MTQDDRPPAEHVVALDELELPEDDSAATLRQRQVGRALARHRAVVVGTAVGLLVGGAVGVLAAQARAEHDRRESAGRLVVIAAQRDTGAAVPAETTDDEFTVPLSVSNAGPLPVLLSGLRPTDPGISLTARIAATAVPSGRATAVSVRVRVRCAQVHRDAHDPRTSDAHFSALVHPSTGAARRVTVRVAGVGIEYQALAAQLCHRDLDQALEVTSQAVTSYVAGATFGLALGVRPRPGYAGTTIKQVAAPWTGSTRVPVHIVVDRPTTLRVALPSLACSSRGTAIDSALPVELVSADGEDDRETVLDLGGSLQRTLVTSFARACDD